MSIYKTQQNSNQYVTAAFLYSHLFTLFALGGALILFVMKYIGLAKSITVLTPIFLILSYCHICSKHPLFLMTEERIGDNAYYLGFLYTLTSLSYALWVFSSSSSAPEDIIKSFGIALSSTIIGVTARVYYSSLRIDPDDIEKDARKKISSTANALTVELHQATSAFNIYRRSLQKSIQEAFIENRKKADEAIADSANKIVGDLDKVSSAINTKYGEINSSSSVLVDSIKNSAKSINSINDKAVKSVSTLHESADAFDGVIKQQSQSIKVISAAVNSLLAMSQAITTQITKTNEQIARLEQAGQNASGLTEKINSNLDSFSTSLSDVAEKQKQVVATITNHADELKLQLHKSRQYTEETHSSLSEMTKTLAERLA